MGQKYNSLTIKIYFIYQISYMHCCKWKNKPLNYSNIKEYYQARELIERNTALDNNSLQKHYAI